MNYLLILILCFRLTFSKIFNLFVLVLNFVAQHFCFSIELLLQFLSLWRSIISIINVIIIIIIIIFFLKKQTCNANDPSPSFLNS